MFYFWYILLSFVPFSPQAIYEPDQCTEYGWLENYKPEAVHYVQRYFSRTNSFVKIEPVLRELPCGKREAISVHYILNKVQNEELPSKVHFYYLVSAERLSGFAMTFLLAFNPHWRLNEYGTTSNASVHVVGVAN